MARRCSLGFELQSASNGVEAGFSTFTFLGGGTSEALSISTAIKHGGNASLRSNPSSQVSYFGVTPGNTSSSWSNLAGPDNQYIRVYIRIASAPPSQQRIIGSLINSPLDESWGIRLNSNRTLELWDEDTSGRSQIGSDSPALDLDTWYRIEISLEGTSVEAFIDEVSFASGSVTNGNPTIFCFGTAIENAGSGDIYFDDIAINDDSGSVNNGLPGEGYQIYLRPNANGDTNTFDSGDYTDTDETPPDDATTTAIGGSSGQILDVGLDSPTVIGDADVINSVYVGARINASSTSGTDATGVTRIKRESAGTVAESASFTLASTNWSGASSYNKHFADVMPGTSDPWTKAYLDTAQIGARATNSVTGNLLVTALWLIIDYTPGEGGGGGTGVSSERDARLVGFENATSERQAKLTGSDLASSERNALLIGADNSTSERSGKLTGTATTTSERGAKTTGSVEDSDERNAKLTGTAQDSDERSGKLTGHDNATSERAGKLTGTASDSNERSVKLTGQQSITSEREASLVGFDTTLSEREAGVVGSDIANSEREATVIGSQTDNDERGAKTIGVDVNSSDRSARTVGALNDDDEREVKITGFQSENSEREAKIYGTDNTFSQREVKISGGLNANNERSSKLIGKQLDDDERFVKITGTLDSSSNRDAVLVGEVTVFSERDTRLSGVDSTSSERSVVLEGQPDSISERKAKLRGSLEIEYDPTLIILTNGRVALQINGDLYLPL